jgi:hypothetical protein
LENNFPTVTCPSKKRNSIILLLWRGWAIFSIYLHRIIWHASSRGVASNNLELENAKGIPGESDKKLKESKQKLQNARKIQSYSA